MGSDPTSPIPMILGAAWLQQEEAMLDFRRGKLVCSLGTFVWPVGGTGKKGVAIAMVGQALEDEGTTSLPIPWGAEGTMPGPTEWEEACKVVQAAQLTERSKGLIQDLLLKYQDTWCGSAVGCARGQAHVIELKSTRPVVNRGRTVPQRWQQQLEEHVKELVEQGAVEPSTSDSVSNPVCVSKPDGSLRLCIDYRKLNENTIPDKHPLPLIQDLLQATAGARHFILIDLRAGFWQIPLSPNSRRWTAFQTTHGLYQWTVLPFGLINAPATFQRWVESILGDLSECGVLTYIDDIMIHAETEDELIVRFEKVLKRLKEAGAKMKMEKVKIAPARLKYLGHIIEAGQRRPDVARVEVLSQIRRPGSIKDVRKIMGMLNWFRHYIPNYSALVLPITRLLSPKHPLAWSDACEVALLTACEILKKAALSVPLVGTGFRLETDASDVALGAVLYAKEVYDQPSPLVAHHVPVQDVDGRRKELEYGRAGGLRNLVGSAQDRWICSGS